MKIVPFNNRILIKEIELKPKESQSGVFIPDFVKDRKNIEKFLFCEILAVAKNVQFSESLVGKRCVVETGMIEEVVIDNQKYVFCPVNYIVCVLEDNEKLSEIDSIIHHEDNAYHAKRAPKK